MMGKLRKPIGAIHILQICDGFFLDIELIFEIEQVLFDIEFDADIEFLFDI